MRALGVAEKALTEEQAVPLRQKSPRLDLPILRATRFSRARSGNSRVKARGLPLQINSGRECAGGHRGRDDGAGKTIAKVITRESRLSGRGSMAGGNQQYQNKGIGTRDVDKVKEQVLGQ